MAALLLLPARPVGADTQAGAEASVPGAAPVTSLPTPALTPPLELRVDPGPLWPAYQLQPGPKDEPLAYVVHPVRYRALLAAVQVDLPQARKDLGESQGAQIKLQQQASALQARAEAAEEGVRAMPCPACQGEGAGWWSGIAWGIVAGTLGSVATAAGIAVWLGR